MGIFAKLFGKKEKSNTPNEYKEALACNNEYESLLSTDKYIARSDYAPILDKYKDIYRFFQNAQQARTLTYYCKRNHLQVQDIEKFLRFYSDSMDLQKGSTIINEHNNKYVREHLVSEKSYLDNILHEVDPKILLDDEQRQVILSDEDYTLIIAGAGAGKTTTVAAKVRYLVERQHIDPKQILVISFTNKAVGELKERINEGLLLPCQITTFHSAGYSILRKQDDIKKKIVGDGFLYL